MSTDKRPKDKVITYLVYGDRVEEASYKVVQEALDSGYRILDVLQAPIPASSALAVTVVLYDAPTGGLQYKATAKS